MNKVASFEKKMKIVFRADASLQIGSGHVMRCLTLAQELKNRGADVLFVCRPAPGDLCQEIRKSGFPLLLLPAIESSKCTISPRFFEKNDAVETAAVLGSEKWDWLVVDHYQIGSEWEKSLSFAASKVMVIDDLANRQHDCDLLLDQNLNEQMEVRYDGLVPERCLKLIGPKYALLRSEFLKAKNVLKKRNGRLSRILLFFGGTDPTDETTKALQALRLFNRPEISVDVVVGSGNPRKDQIRSNCSCMSNTTYHCQVSNMAELMRRADLSLGAGGSSLWERCFLGLPTLTIVTAENQENCTCAVAKVGAIQNLGGYRSVTVGYLVDAIDSTIRDPALLVGMEEKSLQIIGGDDFEGSAGVVSCMLGQ